MPSQSELHPDDGTDISPLTLQCSCNGTTTYLLRESKAVVEIEPTGASEYTFTCPLCSKTVVMRVPHAAGS